MIGLFIHMCLDTKIHNLTVSMLLAESTRSAVFLLWKSATNDIVIVYLIVLFKDTLNM